MSSVLSFDRTPRRTYATGAGRLVPFVNTSDVSAARRLRDELVDDLIERGMVVVLRSRGSTR